MSFFRTLGLKNSLEQKRALQWLRNKGMGKDMKTFKFGKYSVLCENNFYWRHTT